MSADTDHHGIYHDRRSGLYGFPVVDNNDLRFHSRVRLFDIGVRLFVQYFGIRVRLFVQYFGIGIRLFVQYFDIGVRLFVQYFGIRVHDGIQYFGIGVFDDGMYEWVLDELYVRQHHHHYYYYYDHDGRETAINRSFGEALSSRGFHGGCCCGHPRSTHNFRLARLVAQAVWTEEERRRKGVGCVSFWGYSIKKCVILYKKRKKSVFRFRRDVPSSGRH